MNPTFTARPGLLLHESNLPGNFATMFAPDGNKLLPRSDGSSANDAARRYVWAFAWDAPLVEGQVFVFATSDRAIAAVVEEGKLVVGDGVVSVKRYKDGNPWELVAPADVATAAAAVEVARLWKEAHAAPLPVPPQAPPPASTGVRHAVPANTVALVDVKGKGVLEMCAGGKVLYTVDAPIERVLLMPTVTEIGLRGDVELPLSFEMIGDAP